MRYLMIQNVGVCPPKCFTVLGVSMADTTDNQGMIGQFGSGSKHSVAVCIRHNLKPIVFCGSLKMEFFTQPEKVEDDYASKTFHRVCVKYGGKDENGSNRSATEDLGFVLDYGKQDWDHVSLALREFVSNAIDSTIRDNNDWYGVKLEIVDESKVRAKKGYTRVFVPLTRAGEELNKSDVEEFFNNIEKWFLHFSKYDEEYLDKSILPKRNRNFDDRQSAVIYRRGVRVREFTANNVPSLFDYNLNGLKIDEARKASDWDVQYHCGRALANADPKILAQLFQYFLNPHNPAVWEFQFAAHALNDIYDGNTDKRSANWMKAWKAVAGDNAVLTSAASVELLERKGYEPVVVPDGVLDAATTLGLPTPINVLDADDLEGKEISEASTPAQEVVDFVFDILKKHGLSADKDDPVVKCFSYILNAGNMLNGYYRDGTVFLNKSIVPENTGNPSDRLIHVALEELAHYVTGATDNSRDFQNFLLDLSVSLIRKYEMPCDEKSQQEN